MRPIARLIVMHRAYRQMKEHYRDTEKRVQAPASDRKGREAAQEAMRQLFEMQRIADHLVREFSPALAKRRGGGETTQQANLARAAAVTSQVHGWRHHILAMERAFLLSPTGDRKASIAKATPDAPPQASDTVAR